jgi:hypothetical protein
VDKASLAKADILELLETTQTLLAVCEATGMREIKLPVDTLRKMLDRVTMMVEIIDELKREKR